MAVDELPSQERWEALLSALGEGLLERDTAVRLTLLAALSGEHVLLIGPPGTAKSALARRLHRAFDGSRYFERLLTRFSTPEELFGPLSLRALEHDRYERLIEGYLPTAGIAFLDEVFKANSAILNALLTLLNERAFDNGTERLPTPLISVVAASNELPSDDALQAFHDRFLVRVGVAPVGEASFAALLALPEEQPSALPWSVTAAHRSALGAAAEGVTLGDGFVAGCQALRQWLAGRRTGLSDRRWRQWVALARSAAACEGRSSLDELDLGLAPWVAAARPEDTPALQDWFVDDWVQAPPAAAPWLSRAVEAFERQLGLEQQMPADAADDRAGKLALARQIGLGEGGAVGDLDTATMPRLRSEHLEARLQRRWSALHVEARVQQVTEIGQQVATSLLEVSASHAALATRLSTRLWLPRELSGRLLARHAQAHAVLTDLDRRLAATRAGFAALPIDEAAVPQAPAPVGLDD